MLEEVIWGNSVEDWGIFALILLGTIVIVKLLSLFAKKVIKPLTKKTTSKVDDTIYASIEPPILFGLTLIGLWVAFHHLDLSDRVNKVLDSTYRILIVLNFTWFVAHLLNGLIEMYLLNSEKHSNNNRHTSRMLPIIKRTVSSIVWIVGFIMALSNVGVNISALLGTLGIGGVAFALAAQDTIKNIFGAFTILTDKPFNIGDVIRIDDFEGTIIDVGVRSTQMRNYDNRLITFPNYKIADASIINISAEPKRRVVLNLKLVYETTPEMLSRAMDMLKKIPSKIQNVSSDGLSVIFSDFGDSSLNLAFTYFIEPGADILQVQSNVNMEILESFDKAELSFAFPARTVYIQKEDEAEK
ncbi:mechanosensitive ion channel family protein [Bacteroides sp. 224]|uniref:mechanosensitive ion channel family protein n=1 Tax=Bacteroides sp. 224 TaxID=2302936 RepID=UPI0013D85CA3|nr:mechanosensitive ion channel family protein [Bacteroides sp. 224]NDV65099.1 mechanosensitive ion channel family protein [Bacteroides sp. 224]